MLVISVGGHDTANFGSLDTFSLYNSSLVFGFWLCVLILEIMKTLFYMHTTIH